MKRLTVEEFIRRAVKLYGDKYCYSKVEYRNSSTKVCVICRIHGDFMTIPNNFLKGHACPACAGRQRITRAVFIERSNKKHSCRYDYSKVNYRGRDIPVTIICPVHGEFLQKPTYHMNGNGCPRCFGTPKSTTEEFINKAKTVYGEQYDYSKVNYKGNKIKVCIICPKHGEWWVTPNNFLRGSRCPVCFGTPKHTKEEFVARARVVHGDKYDYSKVDYDGLKKNVVILCPIHGAFSQSPASHLNGAGCQKCSNCARITKEDFIKRSLESHRIRYDYSRVKFANGNEKVCIICPKHGEFRQTLGYHMRGGNCPKCVGGIRLTKEDFIEKANVIHENKYDYSKVEYINYSTKVCIVCPEHGEFWQTPNNHLFGAGCPTCPESNLEGEVRQFLIRNNIMFEQEKSFEWLRLKKKLFLDFYLPEYNVAIECQGAQHFFPVDLFGGEDFYNKTLERDNAKHNLCKEHGITVLYFSNASTDYPYPVIETYDELLNSIKDVGKLLF